MAEISAFLVKFQAVAFVFAVGLLFGALLGFYVGMKMQEDLHRMNKKRQDKE